MVNTNELVSGIVEELTFSKEELKEREKTKKGLTDALKGTLQVQSFQS